MKPLSAFATFGASAGGGVDARFLREQILECLARFLADGVAVFEEADFVEIGQRVSHGVGQLVELVAADPYSTALYLRVSSPLTSASQTCCAVVAM